MRTCSSTWSSPCRSSGLRNRLIFRARRCQRSGSSITKRNCTTCTPKSLFSTTAAPTSPTEARPGDLLAVPLANFDVTREYSELYSAPGQPPRKLLVSNPDLAKDLEVLSAVQNIRFQMDEKGVRLRSESHLSLGCSAEMQMEPQHIMIFNKPFLILMQRVDAKTPYFALWVDNPELLVPLTRQ